MVQIVVLAHRVPFPPNKGEKLRTFHQIEELVRIGHKLTVLAPYYENEELHNAKQLADKFGINVVCEKLPHRIVRLILAVLKNRSFSETNFYSSSLQKRLNQHLKDADVLLVTASSLAVYCEQHLQNRNLTKLMDFMDVDSDKWQQYALQSGFLKRLIYMREASKIQAIEKYIAAKFDNCFLIADTEKRLFQANVINTPNIKVLGNGIDQALFNPSQNKSDSETVFLFSGVMDYKPNVDAVMWFIKHSWPQIKEQVNKPIFIIAGMNPTTEVKQLNVDPSIKITGFVDDIKPFFDQAHVFVAPFQIARGVQNKVLQAMACALPVVSTKLGAEGINCEDNKDILLALDANSFTQRCIQLANDPTLRHQIGSCALETINKQYAWDSVLSPLTKALE